MYFFSQNNAFYSWAIKIKPVYRYAITIVTIIAVSYCWLLFFYWPLQYKISKIQEFNITTSAQHLSIMNSYKQDRPQKLIADLKDTIHKNIFFESVDQAVQEGMTWIFERARASDIIINSYVVQAEKNKPWYTKTTIQVTFIGELDKLLYFFEQLRQRSVPISCHNFSLTYESKKLYRCSGTINLYAFKQVE